MAEPRALLTCHFCAWRRGIAPDDSAYLVSRLHGQHLLDHVEDMIRTALLPYDDQTFIPEPSLTPVRSRPPASRARLLRRLRSRRSHPSHPSHPSQDDV